MADNTDMCTQPEPLPADLGLMPDPGLPLDLELPLEHELPLEPQPELPLEPELLLEKSIPLVFNDSIDTTNMTNVLLISSIVYDKQIFYESANANTFPIIYDPSSKTDDLLALFRQKFPASSIQRISLVFHETFRAIRVSFDDEVPILESLYVIIKSINRIVAIAHHVTVIGCLVCNRILCA